MLKKGLYLLFISLTLTILSACQALDFVNELFDQAESSLEDSSNQATEEVENIAELKNTEQFKKGALEHILEGELNHKNQAVGFHYDQLPTKKGEIIAGTKSAENKHGVYEAEVKVSGVEKTSNRGRSTFFPDKWSTQQVIDAINEAYDNRTFISGNTYEGLTADGMQIRMYLDQKDLIISAFPVY